MGCTYFPPANEMQQTKAEREVFENVTPGATAYPEKALQLICLVISNPCISELFAGFLARIFSLRPESADPRCPLFRSPQGEIGSPEIQ